MSGPVEPAETWALVDEHFAPLVDEDDVLRAARRRSQEAGLPDIQVSAAQGRLLALLAETVGARRVLEIGTLGGYSTAWLARALPAGGRLVTCELLPAHAAVARENLAAAGVADRVEVRVGPAAHTLRELVASGEEPFDLVFVDADKPSNPLYLERALELTRPGSVIVLDNAVRGGAVALDDGSDPDVAGVREFTARVVADPRLRGTVVQTVGAKGYDGFLLVRVAG